MRIAQCVTANTRTKQFQRTHMARNAMQPLVLLTVLGSVVIRLCMILSSSRKAKLPNSNGRPVKLFDLTERIRRARNSLHTLSGMRSIPKPHSLTPNRRSRVYSSSVIAAADPTDRLKSERHNTRARSARSQLKRARAPTSCAPSFNHGLFNPHSFLQLLLLFGGWGRRRFGQSDAVVGRKRQGFPYGAHGDGATATAGRGRRPRRLQRTVRGCFNCISTDHR